MRVLLKDNDTPLSRYLSRFWTPFSVRAGIWSPIERLRLKHPGAELFYAHPDAAYARYAARMNDMQDAEHGGGDFDLVQNVEEIEAPRLLETLGAAIGADIEFLLQQNRKPKFRNPRGLTILGPASSVFISETAEILPNVVLDVRDGPIFVGEGARISPFTSIKGPAVISAGAYVDDARLVGPVVIGVQSRVGGEVECSILGDFSNKHHEGFLGHSIAGRWVNIGAMSTTSDLKNNYGEVRLTTPAQFLGGAQALDSVGTGRNKFGSIISDCVKIGIMQSLNTGTVIDVGSSVFRMNVPKYVSPFTWGEEGAPYELDRFVQDCRVIFARRKQAPPPIFAEFAEYLWRASVGAR